MTGYIYNGFGKYEDRKKEKGITLRYAGVEFWLPFGKVTPIPDFHFREVDHAGTAEAWEAGDDEALIYRTLRIPGDRIVEEFTEAQNVGGAEPVKNSQRGIIAIKPTPKNQIFDKTLKAPAGSDENGTQLYEEVRVVTATPEEIQIAETLALEFKKLIIETYFDSKRERMSGGQGRIRATGLEKTFMEELNVSDIDQVNIRTQQAAPAAAASPELMQEFLAFLTSALKAGQTPEKAVALSSEATKKLAKDKAEAALT